ncbi:LytTR family DNA-binding domain-containing protein [Lewinella sp. W8]|uniref:LytR/AlgR family response regulator transcription factor n=1 Tax=Lewinella sp. W8 TaxID=2528208 RepID=UPI0010681772|nr:LytTR family DNA-binding domain-containing protein [Lewinella sp. W8]MTB53967.1 response regulator [Lewinella sp. W8]
MTPLRCLVIDDERLARVEMAALLAEAGHCQVVAQAANVQEALAAIREHDPDVLFLDINMPGGNGFELLENLNPCPLVVFVTAYDQYAIRAFEVHALDYLLKPVHPERLADTVKLIRARLGEGRKERLFLTDRHGGKFIELPELYLVRAYDHYVRLFHDRGTDMLHQSLTTFEERLPGADFFRINRSEIVRIGAVREVEHLSRGRYGLTLPGGETVTVSERQSVLWRKRFS